MQRKAQLCAMLAPLIAYPDMQGTMSEQGHASRQTDTAVARPG